MALYIRVQIRGAAELEKKLSGLGAKLARKVFRKALKVGAAPILHSARANCPVDTGLLVSTLNVKAGKSSRTAVSVNVITGEGFFQGETFYGGQIEFGTIHMKAEPFMRPAFDQNKERSKAVIGKQIALGILSEWAK